MGGGGIIFCHIFYSDGGGVVQKYPHFVHVVRIGDMSTKSCVIPPILHLQNKDEEPILK